MQHRMKQQRVARARRRRERVHGNSLDKFMEMITVRHQRMETDAIVRSYEDDKFHAIVQDQLTSARSAAVLSCIGVLAYVGWGFFSRIFF